MNVFPNINNALVYELGTSAVKFGFTGDLIPLYRVPSYAAQQTIQDDTVIQFGEEFIQNNAGEVEVCPLMDDSGNIAD